MTGSIFIETLRRNWRQGVYWGLVLFIFGWMILAIIPNVDALNQFSELVETMPFIIQAFGGSDIEQMATPEGFLNLEYFGFTVLLLSAFAVMAGLNVTSNEEDEGTLDIVLSLPVTRWRVIVERFLAFVIIAIIAVVIGYIGLWLGSSTSSVDINLSGIASANFHLLATVILTIGITVFVTAVIRRRAIAMGVVAIIIIFSYFINVLGLAAPGSILESVRNLSYFRYYDSQSALFQGILIPNITLLLGLTLVLVIGAIIMFNRRDVGT